MLSPALMHGCIRSCVYVRKCARVHTQASAAERAKNVVEQPGLPVSSVYMRLSARPSNSRYFKAAIFARHVRSCLVMCKRPKDLVRSMIDL